MFTTDIQRVVGMEVGASLAVAQQLVVVAQQLVVVAHQLVVVAQQGSDACCADLQTASFTACFVQQCLFVDSELIAPLPKAPSSHHSSKHVLHVLLNH